MRNAQASRPPATTLRIAAALAAGLIPPSAFNSPWCRYLFRELSAHVSRQFLITEAWPFLRDCIKPTLATRLVPVPAISVSLDEWVVAGRSNRLWAVNVHAVDASWTRFVANLGLVSQLPRTPGVVVDPRPVLDAFGVRDRVFAVVAGRSGEVGLVVDGRLNDMVGDCFRGRCLFSAVADAVYRVCAGADVDAFSIRASQHLADGDGGLVVHGETDLTVDGNAARIARCISSIRDRVEFSTRGLADRVIAGVEGADAIQDVVADVQMDSDSVALAADAAAAAVAAAENVAEGSALGGTMAMRLPKPWVKGNFLSMATEWELMCAMMQQQQQSVQGFAEDHLQTVRENLGDEHWVMTRAVIKVLQLVRRVVGGRERWCLLPDALMKMINLVCAVCDRLTEIELMVDQSLLGAASSQYSSMRQCMLEFVRSNSVRGEDAEGSTAMVPIVEGCLLNRLLVELYPLVQPFVEYMPKQSYCLMALALDPRFGSLASLISLNKKLMQGCRLIFEKELHGEDGESCDDRVRKLVLSMLSRYDNETMIPMMVSLNHKIGNGSSHDGDEHKVVHDGEEGLFAETFEPTDDWKNRQQLEGELSKFRSYKKNIARTASSAESLRWWESNAELFPNIATLFRKVVSVPSSHVPAERILHTDGAKMSVARRRLARSGLEDLVFIHENLTDELLADALGCPTSKGERWILEGRDIVMDDDEVYELGPELFSS